MPQVAILNNMMRVSFAEQAHLWKDLSVSEIRENSVLDRINNHSKALRQAHAWYVQEAQ